MTQPVQPTLVSAQIERLLGLIDRLSAVVTLENQLLADNRPQAIAELQGEKERLSETYHAEMETLRAAPELLQGAEPPQMAALKSAVNAFNDLLDEHRRKLLAAKTVSERLLRAISDEVSKRERPVQGYDQNAAMAKPAHAYHKRPVSLALNQVI